MAQIPSIDLADNENGVVAGISHQDTPQKSAQELADELGNKTFSFILLFVSPEHDPADLTRALGEKFDGVPIFGCTTAGELSNNGIDSGSVVAIGFDQADFTVRSLLFDNIREFSMRSAQLEVLDEMELFQNERIEDKTNCFALLFVDGLSFMEEQIVWSVFYGLKDVPLVGASAGDGLNFGETKIIYDRFVTTDAAVLLLVHSRPPIKIFKSDSLKPTPVKFVVTKADALKRVVYELNGLPAAEVYASAIGSLVSQLDLLKFAQHPLTVRIGDDHYVRSIKEVNSDGSIGFYSAVDEGIVFAIAEVGDMIGDAASMFETINEEIGPPQFVLGLDCIMRRILIEANQMTGQANQLFKENKVIGFNTYGEQFHAMHLNQTFSGIAIGK